MMPGKESLYFIAIIPPDNIVEEVTGFREDFAARFKSRKALRVIPHITLKAPFKMLASQHEEVLIWFQQIPVTISFFGQEIKNFGAFPKNRNPVVFVQPVINDDLKKLQTEILINFKNNFPSQTITQQEFNFKPHITIAYRDLQRSAFIEAWREYQNKTYSAFFKVKDFVLLHHDGNKWNVISTFKLP